jgi:hypothetical protein
VTALRPFGLLTVDRKRKGCTASLVLQQAGLGHSTGEEQRHIIFMIHGG